MVFAIFSENGNFGYAFLPFWLPESPNELFGWCVLCFFRDEHGRKTLRYLRDSLVPNRFGMDLPSRAFYEGVNPRTILNNCPEDTKRHHNRAQTPLNCSRSTHLTPPAGFSWAKWLFRLPGPPKWQLRPPGQPNELFPTPYFDSQTETAAGHGVAADKLVVVVSEIERFGGYGQPAGAKIPVPS